MSEQHKHYQKHIAFTSKPERQYRKVRLVLKEKLADRDVRREMHMQLAPPDISSKPNGIDTSLQNPFMDYMPPEQEDGELTEEDKLEILAMTQQTAVPIMEKHPLYDESNFEYTFRDFVAARDFLRIPGMRIVSEIDFCHAEATDNYEETFQEP